MYCDNMEKVVLVGNGSISEKDREEINKSSCVIRFNNMKNFKTGDKVDAVAVRDNGLNVKKYPTIPIVSDKNKLKSNSTHKPIYLYEPKKKGNNIISDKYMFSECDNRKLHSDTYWGPSTGGVLIDSLQSDENVREIKIYGMNWNGSHNHVDFKHTDIVKNCCTKCEIHPTKSEIYFELL